MVREKGGRGRRKGREVEGREEGEGGRREGEGREGRFFGAKVDLGEAEVLGT
jgi:hypothetical protein